MFAPCKVYKVPLGELPQYSNSGVDLPPESLERVEQVAPPSANLSRFVKSKTVKKALPSWRVKVDPSPCPLMSPRERGEARLEGRIPKDVRLVKKAIAKMTVITPLEDICETVGVSQKWAKNPYLCREYALAVQKLLGGVA